MLCRKRSTLSRCPWKVLQDVALSVCAWCNMTCLRMSGHLYEWCVSCEISSTSQLPCLSHFFLATFSAMSASITRSTRSDLGMETVPRTFIMSGASRTLPPDLNAAVISTDIVGQADVRIGGVQRQLDRENFNPD